MLFLPWRPSSRPEVLVPLAATALLGAAWFAASWLAPPAERPAPGER
ncbi:hypothetical protein PUR61_22385 [Streptomyces sp. BE20]|nr:hypothetical protein [Streptomyces sp. BE20]MEE1824907.1 hypothetical protein [Streptomyces sp. BE20]